MASGADTAAGPAAGSEAWPRASTRVYGVIGDPVRHSLSPVMHNAAFRAHGLDAVFVAFPVAPGMAHVALDAMRSAGIEGLSVTMPHKEAVAHLVHRSPVADRLRAVNTVVRRGGEDGVRLEGDNTDGGGLVDALGATLHVSVRGMRTAVIGTGGAARAVVLAFGDDGARSVAVIGRDPVKAHAAALLAGGAGRVGALDALAEADLIVHATPVGMTGTPHASELATDPKLLRTGQIVVDLVYHPIETPLLAAARERGCVVMSGLGMLVHQAARAFQLWTGREAPVDAMWHAIGARHGEEGVGAGADPGG